MTEATATAIARRYIALWNETDAQRRSLLLVQAWTEDAQYVDPLMQAEGRAGIDALIAAVHQRFPQHRFALTGPVEGHNDRIRFSWTLAADGVPPVARGTDFGVVAADGRLKAVTGFLDAVAA